MAMGKSTIKKVHDLPIQHGDFPIVWQIGMQKKELIIFSIGGVHFHYILVGGLEHFLFCIYWE